MIEIVKAVRTLDGKLVAVSPDAVEIKEGYVYKDVVYSSETEARSAKDMDALKSELRENIDEFKRALGLIMDDVDPTWGQYNEKKLHEREELICGIASELFGEEYNGFSLRRSKYRDDLFGSLIICQNLCNKIDGK